MSGELIVPTTEYVDAKLSPTVQVGAFGGHSTTTCAVCVSGNGDVPLNAGWSPAAPSSFQPMSNRKPVALDNRRASNTSVKPAAGTSGLTGHAVPPHSRVPKQTASPLAAVVVTGGESSAVALPFFCPLCVSSHARHLT